MNSDDATSPVTIIYIGTHKIVSVQASLEGRDPSVRKYFVLNDPEGFEKGFVSNLQKASQTLEAAFNALYERGESRPENASCYVVLGNSKLRTYAYSSSIYYQGVQRTLGAEDMRNVIRQTRNVATLPLTEFILQSIPESYVVNDMENVRNPAGLEAHRLGVNLKIHTMNFQEFKNLSKCFEAIDVEVESYFSKVITVAESVLTEQEKNEGALILDIADDVTTLMLWKEGGLLDTKILPEGGASFTAMLASAWGIEPHDARKLKEKYGAFESRGEYGDELIPIVDRKADGYHQVRHQEFHQKFLELAESWLGGILKQADEFAKTNHVRHPHYLYTGGSVSLQGFPEFLQKTFSRTGKIGLSRQIDAPNQLLVDPSMTGVLGAVKWLWNYEREQKPYFAPQGFLQKTFASAKDWFTAYF